MKAPSYFVESESPNGKSFDIVWHTDFFFFTFEFFYLRNVPNLPIQKKRLHTLYHGDNERNFQSIIQDWN